MQEIVSLFLCTTLFFSLYNNAYTNKSNTSKQAITKLSQDVMNLHMPIVFSNSGMQNFFKYTYNHPHYAQEILAHDFSHLLQFLNYGKKMGQKRAYAKSVIRLFTNKLKSTPYVNGYAFLNMLQQMPPLLRDYFVVFQVGELGSAQTAVTDLMHAAFINQFDTFKENPTLFFDTLSAQIIESLNIKHQITQDVSAEELRKSILLLIEAGLSKLVWAPQEGVQTWDLCKKIGNEMALLLETNLIGDPDDLNDAYISLLERYCYFLDVAHSDLPITFYEELRHGIASDSLLMLEMEEQEVGIETKAERLMRAVAEGEAKARAREMGLLV